MLEVEWENLEVGRRVHGEIVMNEQFPRSGRGHYDDYGKINPTGEEQLWGFWDVQVKGHNTLLVHHTFANQHEVQVSQGYVWDRIKS